VEMSTLDEAQKAISKLNDQPFEGRKLTVNVANSPGSGSRPGGGGGMGGGPRRTPRW
jgi:RNA recognition motif-containing protein